MIGDEVYDQKLFSKYVQTPKNNKLNGVARVYLKSFWKKKKN